MTAPEIELTVGRIASLACLLEAIAPKPGNVHPGADFDDLTFSDFAVSAVVLGNVLDQEGLSLGESILESVRATRAAVGTNTNLGIVLLLAPLATTVWARKGSRPIVPSDLAECLQSLSPDDSQKIFQAIRLAQPGGMGDVESQDINQSALPVDVDIGAAMRASQNRDAIAKQYGTGFADIFETGQTLLRQGRHLMSDLNSAIVFMQVAWMARQPDTLIARKCGLQIAKQSQTLAQAAIDGIGQARIDKGQPLLDREAQLFWEGVGELDRWLRSDGHRRNPGTTADLIAATLFVAIYNGELSPPFN